MLILSLLEGSEHSRPQTRRSPKIFGSSLMYVVYPFNRSVPQSRLLSVRLPDMLRLSFYLFVVQCCVDGWMDGWMDGNQQTHVLSLTVMRTHSRFVFFVCSFFS